MSYANLHGIIGYLITPLTDAGAVDTGRLAALTDDLVASGVHAVSPLGSTGILPLLGDAERDIVVDTVCRQVGGRVPVLVGTSAMTTEGAVRHARGAGPA